MSSTGVDYEIFVQKLIQAIMNSESTIGQKNIVVRHNETICDKNGILRQFDVLWDYELGGITYKTIIECKDYNSPISIEKIDALIGKLMDFPGVRGIIATTKGYQSGAKEKAKKHNIELLCIRDQNDSDWIDSDGTPLVREIVFNMTIISIPKIVCCEIGLDKKHIEENNIDISSINFSDSLNIDVFIEDLNKNEKYSLFDLQKRIADESDTYGEHKKEIIFENAFISDRKIRVKLKKLTVTYQIAKPQTASFNIDFSKELLGVVEYLSQSKKKIILRNGIIRTDDIRHSTCSN